MQGKIIESLAGFYYVESDGQIYQTRARGNFRKKGHKPYVGDEVDFSAKENSEGYILAIHERKNSLVRPPIVNIDQAVVIISAKEPDFNHNLLDRFLILLEHRKISPIIYLSKTDLLEDLDEFKKVQKQYQKIGYYFVYYLEDLTPLLKDKITVFMGQTGVGKTTLLNTLAPDLALETNEISDSLGRGRHTTRAVTLYNIYGGKIADTPGFSSLDYELLKLSAACKFRSCTHTHEPGCAVKLALAQRKIWEKRYQTYLQILSEIENRLETYKKVLKRK